MDDPVSKLRRLSENGSRSTHSSTAPLPSEASSSANGHSLEPICSDNPLQSILRYGQHVSKQLETNNGSAPTKLPLHIAWNLRSVLSTADDHELVIKLRREEADCMVSVMQLWLTTFTTQNNFRRQVISILMKLCSASGVLPRDLFIHGVNLGDDRDPWASGGFADVFRGTYNGQDVAVKRLRVFSEDKAKIDLMLCKEALLWRQLNHPHILSLLGIDIDTFPSRNSPCLVSPWMPRGTLKQYIHSSSYDAPRDRMRLLNETAQGIQYLHEQQMVHGDINWVNVFVDGSASAKIADFGLAIVTEATMGGASVTASGPKGTIAWMSPERLSTSLRLAPPTDVYSLGVLCITMWTKARPFPDMNDFKVVVHVHAGGRPEHPSPAECHGDTLPGAVWELIARCWDQDPKSRPSMSEVLGTLNSWSSQEPALPPEPSPSKKRARTDSEHILLSDLTRDATQQDNFEFNEVLDVEVLKTKLVTVNRAPLTTAWAFVVAERMGFKRSEALSIASAYTQMNTISKGVSLGIYSKSIEQNTAPAVGDSQPCVDILGRSALLKTNEGEWRSLSDKKPVPPATAFGYIQRSFQQATPFVLGSLRLVAKSYSPKELNRRGFSLYMDFRPKVHVWGERAKLSCSTILASRNTALESSTI